jgi:glycine oxidase
MHVDYLIVGFGLASLAFVDTLIEENKTFIVFEDASQTSSNVAGGVYNPVILKRFTPVWQAKEQLEIAIPFYEKLEKKFANHYDYKSDIYRIFKSIEEQNNWFAAADKPRLTSYLDTSIINDSFKGVRSSFGFGKVKHTGRLDTKLLLSDYKKHLVAHSLIRYETFDYSDLQLSNETTTYQDITCDKILFCEGYGMTTNPYFQYLPMTGTKGEILTIHAPELSIDFQIKSSVFVLPLGNSYFKVGATFNWDDKSLDATVEGREELIEKLETVIDVPYTVFSQTAGIRPTVKDRRPLVGIHPNYKQLCILNGLGTRGVMVAPKMAQELFHFLEKGTPLNPEIDIKRFEDLI